MTVLCVPYGGEDERNYRRVSIWCRLCGDRDGLFMRDGQFYCRWHVPVEP